MPQETANSDLSDELQRFYRQLDELYLLKGIDALLDWDLHTYIPPAGAEARSQQQRLLSEILQRHKTDADFLALVDRLADSLPQLAHPDAVNVREIKRQLDRARKLPPDFVGARSRLRSRSYAVWAEARPRNDFNAVKPYLEELLEFNRREIDLVGYEEHPYDALLDLYEPKGKIQEIKPLLLELGAALSKLLPKVQERQQAASDPVGPFPLETQRRLCEEIAAAVGYSFDTGRLDPTAHPFETRIGTRDVRITTRYDENDYLTGLYPMLHEVGHALYELGLPERHAGTPLGTSVSLGIHESQSRLWENLVGRSRSFVRYLHQTLGRYFPEEQARTTPDELWQRINRVEPSLIRVDADEVSYSLHIIIRMLLEEAMLMGELRVEDLPDAWSSLYEEYLGIRPRDHRNGVMQDVHWFTGSMGYFPTYALGNIYGAEMMAVIRADLPELDQQIEQGEFSALRGWLQKQVFDHGMEFYSTELVSRITGHKPGIGPFVSYLEEKFGV